VPAVYAQNQLGVQYNVPEITPPLTLEPFGTTGDTVNITSELRALSAGQYPNLEPDQVAGNVRYIKTGFIDFATPGLTLNVGDNVFDEAKNPRTATLSIAALNTPSYFNCLGQPVKTVQIINPNGAFELEIWGSIDNLNPAFANKQWVHRSTIRRSAGATIHNLREDLINKIDDDQFLRFDVIRGAVPLDVLVRTTF
jgi:hypothetical protein